MQPAHYIPMPQKHVHAYASLQQLPYPGAATPLFGSGAPSPVGSQAGENLLGGSMRRSSFRSPAAGTVGGGGGGGGDVEMMQQMMAEINRLKGELAE